MGLPPVLPLLMPRPLPCMAVGHGSAPPIPAVGPAEAVQGCCVSVQVALSLLLGIDDVQAPLPGRGLMAPSPAGG